MQDRTPDGPFRNRTFVRGDSPDLRSVSESFITTRKVTVLPWHQLFRRAK